MQAADELRQWIYQTIEKVNVRKIAVAFSGGVDSSLLAKACKDIGKNVTLLTVGFSSQVDIKFASEVAKVLNLNLLHDLVPLNDLEDGIRNVLAAIEVNRLVRLENCVCFYYVFRLASQRGLKTVVSANGVDELFCGYSAFKTRYGDETALKSLTDALVETAIDDKAEMDKISELFKVEYLCPFLSKDFVDFATKIPFEQKIKGTDDNIRKHIFREAALRAGVPQEAALRTKKAFQYSSGVHKAIKMLAKANGFTKSKAKAAGFKNEIDAYIANLKRR